MIPTNPSLSGLVYSPTPGLTQVHLESIAPMSYTLIASMEITLYSEIEMYTPDAAGVADDEEENDGSEGSAAR